MQGWQESRDWLCLVGIALSSQCQYWVLGYKLSVEINQLTS